MNLQDTLEAIRRKAFPKRYALEAELTELRAAHVHVSNELDSVRGELSETRAQDARQLTELQQQMTVIAGERKAATNQVHLLETSLAEAGARQRRVRPVQSRQTPRCAKPLLRETPAGPRRDRASRGTRCSV